MMKRNNKLEVVAADHPKSSSMSGCTSSTAGDDEVRRGPWTLEEDSLLTNYIVRHGEGRWNMLAKCAGLKRTGKSCRLRWLNYLKPDTKRGNLTSQEQLLILQLHSKWGNRWSKIAQHLPGRTDNEIKNYWRTRVQKQARLLNIDGSTASSHHHDTFLELAAVRSCLWSTPTCGFHLHKLMHHHQTNSSPPPPAFNHTITTTDHSDHQAIHDITNKPVIYTSAPPPNLAPPSISTTHQSQLQPAPAPAPALPNYNSVPAGIINHDFSDQVQIFPPQSSWGDQGAGHATANISYNYNLDQSCNNIINNGYDDDHDQMLGNCTVASTSALQPYFDPNSTHDQCHDMEIRADLAYVDVANTSLWNMDDIWQIRDDQEFNRSGRI